MWPKMAYSELSKPIQNQNFNFNGLELISVVVRLFVCMISNDTKKIKACYVVYEIVIIDLAILLLKIR